MDLDSLIIWAILFFVFVLPSLKKRKKKAEAAGGQNRATSGIGALKERLKTFLREMEQQALEAKKNAENQENRRPGGQNRQVAGKKSSGPNQSIWELLDDRESPVAPETVEAVVDPGPSNPVEKAPDFSTKQAPAPRMVQKEREKNRKTVQKPDMPLQVPAAAVRATLPRHALQQAVVWSEILGPPKALTQESFIGETGPGPGQR